jgi:hypothetical protein
MDDVLIPEKNPHAVAMGRMGGAAGTGEKKRRSKAHYSRASKKRWREHKLKAGKYFPPMGG